MRLGNKFLISISAIAAYFCTSTCFASESAQLESRQISVIESQVAPTKADVSATGVKTIESAIQDGDKQSDAIGEILIQAMSLMGISYKWGGNTPETGMDCSGFIRYVFKKAMGINLPRTANEMSKVGIRVSVADMKPGDLIFFNTLRGRRNSHLGMYIGNNQFIQSPHTGARIEITDYNDYWRAHTNGVKRIVAEDNDSSGATTVETFEDVTNQALPSGYIRGKRHIRGRHHRSSSGVVSGTKSAHAKKAKTKTAAKHKKSRR